MHAACDACGKKYDVSGKRPGAAFRCPTCKEGTIRVPAVAAAPEPVPSEPEAPAAEERHEARPARAGTRRAHATRGGHAHHVPNKKSSNALMMGIGVGALVVAGIVYMLVSGGKEEIPSRDPGPKTDTSTAEKATEPVKPTPVNPAAEFQTRLAKLEKADLPGRVELASFAEKNGMLTPARSLRREVLLLDPNHEETRKALGFERYSGKVTHLQGRWLDEADRKRAAEVEKFFSDSGLAKAATTQDAFKRNCDDLKRKMIDEFPESKWFYAFGNELMPQPFFVLIEKPKEDGKLDEYRAEYSEILSALYETFFERYEKRFKLDRDIERPIRVVMFDSVRTYSTHRSNFPDLKYPDPQFIGGYYQPWEQRLIMWRGQMKIKDVLFHEGTHMFVHYAFSGKGFETSRQTPWLQEGIAELFAGNKVISETVNGVARKKYVLNQFLPGRYSEYRMFMQMGTLLPVKELVAIDNYKFEQAKQKQGEGGDEGLQAGMLVSQIYCNGWVLCMYLNWAEDGKLKNILDDYIEAETKGEGFWQKLGELLGLKTDDDWAAFDEKVRKWAVEVLPKMK